MEDGVVGPMESIGETPLAETIAVAMSSPFEWVTRLPYDHRKTKLVDTVPFPAYTREIIQKQGCTTRIGKKSRRWIQLPYPRAGRKLLLAEDVFQIQPGLVQKLWSSIFSMAILVRALQNTRGKWVSAICTSSFILSLLASLILTISPPGMGSVLSIIGVYIAATLIASTITAGKKGWNHLVRLPLAYGIIHLSYSSGFLSGLVKFWNRWG